MTKIFVMIIWVGAANGGPSTIQGFDNLESCNTAIASLKSQLINFEKENANRRYPPWSNWNFSAQCFALDK